ncbi:MAG TPA: hypothetical protein VFI51_10175 [Bradyrhizobium sp.]|nr:hypothetical protein [Bradyrhizobium sp.]
MTDPLNSGDTMDVFYVAALAGLLGLVVGILLVNIVSTPRAAQIGTIIATCGVLMLVVVAVRHLFI